MAQMTLLHEIMIQERCERPLLVRMKREDVRPDCVEDDVDGRDSDVMASHGFSVICDLRLCLCDVMQRIVFGLELGSVMARSVWPVGQAAGSDAALTMCSICGPPLPPM